MHRHIYDGLHEAHPIRYQGRVYQSRSEAKWARVLDLLGIPTYYEPSTYTLASGKFLPDFWIPSMDAYLEVKPFDVADARYGELGMMRGKRVFLVSGDLPYATPGEPEYRVYPSLRGHIWLKWPDPEPDYMLAREHSGRLNIVPIALASSVAGNDPIILRAYQDALSYSFERL